MTLDLFDVPAEVAPGQDRATLAVLFGRTPSELDRCDAFFDEWRSKRIPVQWRHYRNHRLAGTWNARARELFPGDSERFEVEEELHS